MPDEIAAAGTPGPAPVLLRIWSDYVCPFCYLDLPVVERLQHDLGEALVVDWRAFELRPDPVPTLDPDGAYLHRVWNAAVYPMSEERGMILRLPPVQPRTRLAHEAAEVAREAGLFAPMHLALFQAIFEHGRDIGSVPVLMEIGLGVGVPGDRLQEALAAGTWTSKVLGDQALALGAGVASVPALHLLSGERRVRIEGQRTHQIIRAAIDRLAAAPV